MLDYLELLKDYDLPQKDNKSKKVMALIIIILIMIFFVFFIMYWNLTPDEPESPIAIIIVSKTEIFQGETIIFSSDNSYDNDGKIDAVKWDITKEIEWKNETYNQHNFNLTFHETGKFNVRLTVRDDDNRLDDDLITITVLQAISIEIYDFNSSNNFKITITNNGGNEFMLYKDQIYFQILSVKSNKYDCLVEANENIKIPAYGFVTIELDPEYYYNDIADKLIFKYNLDYGHTIDF